MDTGHSLDHSIAGDGADSEAESLGTGTSQDWGDTTKDSEDSGICDSDLLSTQDSTGVTVVDRNAVILGSEDLLIIP